MKCKEHAKMMSALCGGVDQMGPKVRAVYNKFMEQADEECIVHETQVVYLFRHAFQEDLENEEIITSMSGSASEPPSATTKEPA